MQKSSFVRTAVAVIPAVLLSGSMAMGQSGRGPSGMGGSSGMGNSPLQAPSNSGANGRNTSDPNSIMRPPDDLMNTPESRDMLVRREAARKLERKRRMVDSANRLLALTEQLRAELQTREATPADAVRLDEIAKLARSVKDQMRN